MHIAIYLLILSLPARTYPPALQDVQNLLSLSIREKIIEKHPLTPLYSPPFTTHGQTKCLVVLTETPSEKLSWVNGCGSEPLCQITYYREMFFREPGEQYRYYPGGSIREFYREASCGKFDFYGTVTGIVTLDYDISYYACGSGNGNSGCASWDERDACLNNSAPTITPGCHNYIMDVVDKLAPHINFADYDTNGDGEVDCFIVVHPGEGAEQTCDSSLQCDPTKIWSHFWYLKQPKQTGDGNTYVWRYLIGPDWSIVNRDKIEMGVFAHEFGHYLGLVDLYDRDYTSCGLGPYSLMAYGTHGYSPNELDPLSRDALGWENLIPVDGSQCEYSLYPAETSCEALLLGYDGPGDTEFFLAEYRKPIGFDVDLPQDRSPDFTGGILIYHVDTSVEQKFCSVNQNIEGRCNPAPYCPIRNECEWYPGLNPEYHYLIALKEAACSSYDLETPSDIGVCDTLSKEYHFFNDTDRNVFTPNSCPDSRDYLDETGNGPSLYVKLIGKNSALITAIPAGGELKSPVITSSPPSDATSGEAYTYTPEVTGTYPISFTLTHSPPGVEFDPDTGKIVWQIPENISGGSYRFTLIASNCAGSFTQDWLVDVMQVQFLKRTASNQGCIIENLFARSPGTINAFREARGHLLQNPLGGVAVKFYYTFFSPAAKLLVKYFPGAKGPLKSFLRWWLKWLSS